MVVVVDCQVRRQAVNLVSQGKRNLGRVKSAHGDSSWTVVIPTGIFHSSYISLTLRNPDGGR